MINIEDKDITKVVCNKHFQWKIISSVFLTDMSGTSREYSVLCRHRNGNIYNLHYKSGYYINTEKIFLDTQLIKLLPIE